MRIDWIYEGCDEHDVPAIEEYWEQVKLELDGKLAELSDAPTELRIAVERDDSNPTWEINAALHLPGRTLVATGTAPRPESALDIVLHGLAEQVDSLEDNPERMTERRQGTEGVLELLKGWHTENRSQAFLSFITPLIASVGPYVQRELRVREIEEQAIGEQISTSDILDEVLLQSWERFGHHHKQQAFDLWLVQLADEALDRLCRHVAEESIDETTEMRDDSLSDGGDSWVERVSYPETIELSELLPAGPGIETWDSLDLDAKETHLSEMLSALERDQRQAFVLNLAHGFSAAEIADFQDRAATDVEEDIARAKMSIRRWLVDEETPDQEEPFVREEMRNQKRRR